MISRSVFQRQTENMSRSADRKEAIAYAIHHGEPGDIIVLAGKGHEDYQEIKGKKYPMDERVLIEEILREDKEMSRKINRFMRISSWTFPTKKLTAVFSTKFPKNCSTNCRWEWW